MKLKFLLLFFAFLLAAPVAQASFPVSRTAIATNMAEEDSNVEVLYSPAAVASEKSQGLALVFFLVFGLLAGHRWYLGSPWPYNILFIFTLGGLGIWALVDLIGIITKSYGPVEGRYKKSFF